MPNNVIIESAKQVYFSYLSLSYASTDRSAQRGVLKNIDNRISYNGKIYNNLQDIIAEQVSKNLDEPFFRAEVLVGNTPMYLDCIKDGQDTYQIQLSKKTGYKSPLPEIKDFTEYSLNRENPNISEVFENINFRFFLTNNKLGVDLPRKSNDPTSIITLGGELGQLWDPQINSLGQMINSGNPSMLIDLATGAGKSFLQAAWYIACNRADIPVIFSVPDATLVQQLYNDFKKIVPTQIMAEIDTNLNIQNSIISHFELLQRNWDQIAHAPKIANTQIIIDEFHLATREELHAKRIETLNKKTSVLGFTATPTKRVLDILGKPVSSFTKRDKIDYGLVQEIHVNSKNSDSSSKRINLSSAHEYFKESETTIIPRHNKLLEFPKTRDRIRWGIQFPLGEKSLILTDSYDVVENIGRISSLASKNYQEPSRGVRLKFVQDHKVIVGNQGPFGNKESKEEKEEIVKKRKEFKQKVAELAHTSVSEAEKIVDFQDSENYMKLRAIHGLIENYIKAATGLTTEQLDLTRQQQGGLISLKEQVLSISSDKIEEYLKSLAISGIPEEEIKLMREGFQYFSNKLKAPETSEKFQLEFIDNWTLDRSLHKSLKKDKQLQTFLENYGNSHNIAISVTAKNNQGHSTESGSIIKTFSMQLSNSKARHSYWPYNIKQIDAMFKAGIIGSYVTSEKIAGFSDPDLQHLAVLVDDFSSKLNAPSNAIQAFGRARGLNFQRPPYFIGISKRGIEFSIDFEALESGKDFNLVDSLIKYQQEKEEKVLHIQIFKDIQEVINQYISSVHSLSNDRIFRAKCDEILNRHFIEIYNDNNHDLEKSKEIFTNILEKVESEVSSNKKHITWSIVPQALSIGTDFISQSIKFIEALYSKKKLLTSLAKTEDEQVYARIINNYSIEDITRNAVSLGIGLGHNAQQDLENLALSFQKNIHRFMDKNFKLALGRQIKTSLSASKNNLGNEMIHEFLGLDNGYNNNRIINAIIVDFLIKNQQHSLEEIKTIGKPGFQIFYSLVNIAKKVSAYQFNLADFLTNDKEFQKFLEIKSSQMPESMKTDFSSFHIFKGITSFLIDGNELLKSIKLNSAINFVLEAVSERITPYLSDENVKTSLNYFIQDNNKLPDEDLLVIGLRINPGFFKGMDLKKSLERIKKFRSLTKAFTECNNTKDTKKAIVETLQRYNYNILRLQQDLTLYAGISREIISSFFHYHNIPIHPILEENGVTILPPVLMKGNPDSKVWTVKDSFKKSMSIELPIRQYLVFGLAGTVAKSLPFEDQKSIVYNRLLKQFSMYNAHLGALKELEYLDENSISSNEYDSYLNNAERQLHKNLRRQHLRTDTLFLENFMDGKSLLSNNPSIGSSSTPNESYSFSSLFPGAILLGITLGTFIYKKSQELLSSNTSSSDIEPKIKVDQSLENLNDLIYKSITKFNKIPALIIETRNFPNSYTSKQIKEVENAILHPLESMKEEVTKLNQKYFSFIDPKEEELLEFQSALKKFNAKLNIIVEKAKQISYLTPHLQEKRNQEELNLGRNNSEENSSKTVKTIKEGIKPLSSSFYGRRVNINNRLKGSVVSVNNR